MAKGNNSKRGNKEAKKPKQEKPKFPRRPILWPENLRWQLAAKK